MPLHRLPLAVLLGLLFCLLGRPVVASPARPGPLVDPKEDPRTAFRKLITPLRPSELFPQDDAPVEKKGLSETAFRYNTRYLERIGGILIKEATAPEKSPRRPVVIVLHGTGGNKDGQRKVLAELAKAGFIGVAIDGAHHGARAKGGNAAKASEYVEAIGRAYWGQFPFFYSTAWDIMRLIDYLETRDDVDAKRIALWGFSKGGIEAYLVAAADTRVAATVSCIAVQSFGWALENDAWQSRIGTVQAAFDAFAKKENISNTAAASVRRFYDQVAYGIHSHFDGQVMVPLVAPRPFLAINGDSDPRTPLPGLKLCTDAAEAAYAAAGVPQNFTHILQPNTGHKVTPAAMKLAQEWLIERLKP